MDRRWVLALTVSLVLIQVLTVISSLAARTVVFPILESIFNDYGAVFPGISVFYFSYIEPCAFLLPVVFLGAFVFLLRGAKYEAFIPPVFASGAILTFGLVLLGISAYIYPMLMVTVWSFEKLTG